MSELQEDSVVVESDLDHVEQQTEIEHQENDGAGLAPASEVEHENNQQNIAQDKVQQVINKKHFEAKQAERERDEYKQQLEQLKAQQHQQANQEPIVPPMPDAFDDDYENKMQVWQQKTVERAKWEANQDAIRQHQERQAFEQQQKQAQELQATVNTYKENAKGFGIDEQELTQIGTYVSNSGISMDLQVELLNDPEGALIVKQLASEPQTLDALTKMTPYQAANYINANVRPKAMSLKPKATNAPPPPDNLNAGTVDKDAGRYSLVANAKFE